MKLYRSLILFLLLTIGPFLAMAQIPSDLSKVKSVQISDAQLQQLLDRAKSSGISPVELETELTRRGLPPEELADLKLRIQMMDTTTVRVQDPELTDPSVPSRSLTKPRRTAAQLFEPEKPASRIFGADLFSNSNLSFEPDLRIPTPKNYTIGPDDEIIINVYGQNISQQRLKVSPEGTVNIKYAGIIPVSGLSVEGATALLKSALTKYYPALKSGGTKLELSLGNIRSIRVVLIGAINRPGTYTLPSLATVFNALYVSGGPSENGSFRNIELIRNNKVVQVADLYDFLLRGDQRANVRLQDNDVIRVPFAKLLVTLNGELNRSGIFEMKPEETLEDAVNFAGGFKSKAFRGRITGKRYASLERSILDVSGDSLAFFHLENGDEFTIDSLIDRYQNRVMIKGAVFKPGEYALEPGMTLRNLIEKAQGLKEDVFTGKAFLMRTRPDLSKLMVPIDLLPVVTGKDAGPALVREDSVYIASIFDLRDSSYVTINGAVRKPGTYRFEDSLSLQMLLLKAGGYAENATGMGIEISRRKRDIEINRAGSEIVELIRVDLNKDLEAKTRDIYLKPFDIVSIKSDPYYKSQIMVRISGEVLLPANYTLQSREERLSSLIKRSGGLLYTADIRGAKLIRLRKENVDTLEVKRLLKTAEKDTTIKARVDNGFLRKKTTDVAIDLAYILSHPGSKDDITLEEGDELVIPRINNTVSINGEVFKPLDIMYESGKRMPDYLSDAGGVTQMGKKNRAFVIYANGSSAKIKRSLGIFPRYPKIYPGSSIYVPQKPKRDGQFDVAKAGILVSAVTALVTAISLLVR
jgi:protein involved in polysaccharide export with SLBB domain